MSDNSAKKLFLVVNPVSGKKTAKQYMKSMIESFHEGGFNVTACCTQIDKNAYDIVLNRGAEFDVIVCVGGDGTLKETVCAVIELGTDTPIGYIPMGSTNDFAYSLGIPTNVNDAVRAIIDGEPKSVDMGKFGSEFFVYVAGFGNFTAISYSASQKMKNVLGKNAYYLQAVHDFFHMKPYHARIEADGEVFEGDYFYGAASNSYSVAGMPVLHNIGVEFDDGLHELILVNMFKKAGDILSLVRSMAKKDVINNELVTIRHCKNIKFMFDEPTAFTLDGEFGGEQTEVTAVSLEKVVRMIIRPEPEKEDSENGDGSGASDNVEEARQETV